MKMFKMDPLQYVLSFSLIWWTNIMMLVAHHTELEEWAAKTAWLEPSESPDLCLDSSYKRM